jgi:hypothetical protein
MKILTQRNINKFIYKWILQASCDFENYLKNYVIKHYQYNPNIIDKIAKGLEDVELEFRGNLEIFFDEESRGNIIIQGYEGSFDVDNLTDDQNELYLKVGDLLGDWEDDVEEEYWIAKAEVDVIEQMRYSLGEHYVPSMKTRTDFTGLAKLKKLNSSALQLPYYLFEMPIQFSALMYNFNVFCKQLRFQYEIVTILIRTETLYFDKLNSLLKEREYLLPELQFGMSLEQSKKRYIEVEKLYELTKGDEVYEKPVMSNEEKNLHFSDLVKFEHHKILPLIINEYKGALPKRKVCMLYVLYKLGTLKITPNNIKGIQMINMFHNLFNDDSGTEQSCNRNKNIFKMLFISDSRDLQNTVKEADLTYFTQEEKIISNFI